jgi:hypothetical protein
MMCRCGQERELESFSVSHSLPQYARLASCVYL